MANANTTAQNQSSKGWTPEELAQLAADAMDDEVFAKRTFEILEAAPAILSREQVEDLEKQIRGDVARRSAFLMASLTGHDLLNKIENDRDFAVTACGIAGEMESLQAKYRQLADLFERIDARITIALASREDMQQVREEGKAVFA